MFDSYSSVSCYVNKMIRDIANCDLPQLRCNFTQSFTDYFARKSDESDVFAEGGISFFFFSFLRINVPISRSQEQF